MSESAKEKILVIKLSALGDFIQALGPMKAIRKHHPKAHITLLTTEPYKAFGQHCGYFDDVWIDDKPKLLNIRSWGALRKKLNIGKFTRVYDLQNNDRTGFYFKLLASPKPEWVGVAPGASHRNTSPDRTAGHAFDGHAQTLALAGIKSIEVDSLEWMKGDVSVFPLRTPYVLLVPGCAPQHPQKRWPADKYGRLSKIIISMGYQPIILGTDAEVEAAQEILKECPQSLDLTNQTNFNQVVTLAHDAAFAIGNDTGPMHLIASTGCPSLVLFSNASNPVRHAPKGDNVSILQRDNLKDLRSEEVLQHFKPRGQDPRSSRTKH